MCLPDLTPLVPWMLPFHCASGQGMERGGLRDVHSAGTNIWGGESIFYPG